MSIVNVPATEERNRRARNIGAKAAKSNNRLQHLIALCSLSVLFILGGSNGSTAMAEETSGQVRGVAIDEKLGDRIPMDLVFKDEDGKDITLKQVADGKPLIVDMAYYECPGICDVVLAGLTAALDKVSATPGKDFNVVTVSFNPADNPKVAMNKKDMFWGQLQRPFPSDSWRFLTGDSTNIYSLTNALGFYFKKESDGTFIHPTALMIVDKDGKIIRYIQGTTFAPVDLKMGILEAQAGTPEKIVSALLCVCFSHTPEGDHLAFNVLGVIGIGTVVFAAGFVVFLRSTKKIAKNQRKLS
jgi:protein SCO1